jgi:signal transduction histidine kinase
VTLRLRLTLWNVGVLALAFLALGMFLRKRTEMRVRGEIDRQLMAPAHRLPRGPGSPPLDDRPEMPPDVGRRGAPPDSLGFRPPPPPPRLRLYSAKGEPLFGAPPAPNRQEILEVAATHKAKFMDQGQERLYTYPFFSHISGEWEYFQSKASLEPVQKEVDNVTRDLFLLLPFALVLAGAGGLFLTSRVLHPLRALTEATGRIGASGLSERLPVSPKSQNDEMGQLSLTFNAMLERLETAFNQQKRFVADASHELRSPLTVIKTSAELGMTEEGITPEARSLFARIDRAADRTNRLVQNLLLLARGDGKGLNVQPTTFLTATFFASAVEEAKARRPESAQIITDVTSEHSLNGDTALLHQVLVNLLDNALRHTPSEGMVTLKAIDAGFTVTDTGIGIPAEHLPHLGERFYRVDAARTRSEGGTGLGLAICRSIIEAHDGTVTFSSPIDATKDKINTGTEVTVRWELPQI